MFLLLLKSNVAKILAVFSLQPGRKFRRKELKELTKLNNVPLDSALNLLKATGIIKAEGKKYRFNFEKEEIIRIIQKEHAELNKIPLKVLFAVLDVAEKLAKRKCDLYLFGSYAKGSYTPESDVDLAVICDEKMDFSFVRKIEKRYGVKI